jgi:hypothetical protein
VRWISLLSFQLVFASCGKSPAQKAPSCEQAIDAAFVLYDHQARSETVGQSPDERRQAREAAIKNCELRSWDAIERACLVAASDVVGMVDCHLAGDRRRHPKWTWSP